MGEPGPGVSGAQGKEVCGDGLALRLTSFCNRRALCAADTPCGANVGELCAAFPPLTHINLSGNAASPDGPGTPNL